MVGLANEENARTLSPVAVWHQSRPIHWEVDNPKTESTLFSTFDQDSIEALGNEEISLHNHGFGVLTETFEES